MIAQLRVTLATYLLSALCVSVSAAQNIAEITLQPTGKEIKQGLQSVTGLRELANGEAIVVDGSDHRIFKANLATGTLEPVGTNGSGPNEYLTPWTVMKVGTGTMIHDWPQNRMLLLDAAGQPARTRTLPKLPATIPGPDQQARADDHGTIYIWSSPFVRSPEGMKVGTARAILRLKGDPMTVDTIASVPIIPGDASVQMVPGGGSSTQWGAANPFSRRDQFTVMANGNVALVHASPYQVEWITPDGKHSNGPVIAYTPIPVTAADKKEYGAKHGSGGSSVSSAPVGATAAPVEEGGRSDWPATKTPFLYDGVQADPLGTIWVLRTTFAGDTQNHYDVIDAGGRLIHRYVVPNSVRVIGFGNGVIYATRTASDGERYVMTLRRAGG